MCIGALARVDAKLAARGVVCCVHRIEWQEIPPLHLFDDVADQAVADGLVPAELGCDNAHELRTVGRIDHVGDLQQLRQRLVGHGDHRTILRKCKSLAARDGPGHLPARNEAKFDRAGFELRWQSGKCLSYSRTSCRISHRSAMTAVLAQWRKCRVPVNTMAMPWSS